MLLLLQRRKTPQQAARVGPTSTAAVPSTPTVAVSAPGGRGDVAFVRIAPDPTAPLVQRYPGTPALNRGAPNGVARWPSQLPQGSVRLDSPAGLGGAALSAGTSPSRVPASVSVPGVAVDGFRPARPAISRWPTTPAQPVPVISRWPLRVPAPAATPPVSLRSQGFLIGLRVQAQMPPLPPPKQPASQPSVPYVIPTALPSGLTALYNPADSRNTVAGGKFATLKDLSGNGFDLTQGTGAAQPAQVTDPTTGRLVAEFDGANTFLQQSVGNLDNLIGLTTWSVVAEVLPIGTPSSVQQDFFSANALFGSDGENWGIGLFDAGGGVSQYVAAYFDTNFVFNSDVFTNATIDAWQVLSTRKSLTQNFVAVDGTESAPQSLTGQTTRVDGGAEIMLLGRGYPPVIGNFFNGRMGRIAVFNRTLTQDEVAAVRSLWAMSASPITGAVAVTQQPDSALGVGQPLGTINGVIAEVQQSDRASAVGSPSIPGSVNTLSVADDGTAAGSPVVAGSSAVTQVADDGAASGTQTVTGSAADAQVADDGTASGTPVVTGTSAVTQAADIAVASGTPVSTGTTGTVAVTQPPDAPSASGTSIVTGTVARTAGADAGAAAGAGVVAGSIARTAGADVGAAAGKSTVTGTASAQAPDVGAASGKPTVTGTIASTSHDVGAASGSSPAQGTVAVTQRPDVGSASGSPMVAGALAVTQARDAGAATGSPLISGNIAAQSADTASAAGAPAVTGTLSVTAGVDFAFAIGPAKADIISPPDVPSIHGTSIIVGTVAVIAGDTGFAEGIVLNVRDRIGLTISAPAPLVVTTATPTPGTLVVTTPTARSATIPTPVSKQVVLK